MTGKRDIGPLPAGLGSPDAILVLIDAGQNVDHYADMLKGVHVSRRVNPETLATTMNVNLDWE